MPGEYAEATKATTVTDASDGSFNVELTIDLPSGGASDEDMFDTIAFEASYLIDEIFAEPPYPLNFKIHFLKDGADFGDIERAHDKPRLLPHLARGRPIPSSSRCEAGGRRSGSGGACRQAPGTVSEAHPERYALPHMPQ